MQKQMAAFRHIWNRLRAFGKADKIHHEVSEEFAFHLDMKVAELMNSGMGEEEARRIAQQSFGRQTALREQAFALRGAEWLEDFWRDLRFSFRLMQKNLGRTAVLAATLAVGIGLSAALFSIVRSILLRPLPFADSGSLVILHQANGSGAGGVSYPHYRDWKAGARSFESMAVFSTGESTLTALDHAERVNAATVSANLFSLLRVHPLRGRLFRSDEDRLGGGTGGERPILINEEFWRGHMGGRNDIAGQHVTLDGFSFRIAGVIPAALAFPAGSTPVAFWTTVAMDAEPSIYGGAVPEARGYPRYDGVIARLRPGITAQEAAADMKRLASVIAAAHPNATGMNDVVVRSALGELVGRPPSVAALKRCGVLRSPGSLRECHHSSVGGRHGEASRIRHPVGPWRTRGTPRSPDSNRARVLESVRRRRRLPAGGSPREVLRCCCSRRHSAARRCQGRHRPFPLLSRHRSGSRNTSRHRARSSRRASRSSARSP